MAKLNLKQASVSGELWCWIRMRKPVQVQDEDKDEDEGEEYESAHLRYTCKAYSGINPRERARKRAPERTWN